LPPWSLTLAAYPTDVYRKGSWRATQYTARQMSMRQYKKISISNPHLTVRPRILFVSSKRKVDEDLWDKLFGEAPPTIARLKEFTIRHLTIGTSEHKEFEAGTTGETCCNSAAWRWSVGVICRHPQTDSQLSEGARRPRCVLPESSKNHEGICRSAQCGPFGRKTLHHGQRHDAADQHSLSWYECCRLCIHGLWRSRSMSRVWECVRSKPATGCTGLPFKKLRPAGVPTRIPTTAKVIEIERKE
jgi:hypothetical protein